MRKNKCENEFCIYYDKNNCVLDSLNLDNSGNCIKCIHIEIDKEYLEKERQIQLAKIEQ